MKIAFIGDVALFGRFDIENLPKDYFKNVSNFLNDFDLVVANLEAPFISDADVASKCNKSALISSRVENVALLKQLNVSVACLANNHIFDYGINGLKKTINTLEENNIHWFGVNDKSLYFENEKLSLHGFCSYNTNPIGFNFSKNYFLNPTHFYDVMKCIESDLNQGNVSIICNHSGIENIPCPSEDDINFARYISTFTNYIYIGHHPHVIQGSENFNNSYLTYSLGNFCFDDIYDERTNQLLVKQTEDNRHGLIKIFEIENAQIIDSSQVICYQGEDSLELDVEFYKQKSLADIAIENVDSSYNEKRKRLIQDCSRKRNASRNFTWLINRLSLSTLLRLYHRRLNSHCYKKYYSSKIPR